MTAVSVIIVNYNTFRLSSDCIRSVLKFTKQLSCEIVLVDNGSTECPAENFLAEFPEIILVRSEKNLGFAGGNNLGIARSKGETILLLNSDTELKDDAISSCYSKLMADPSIGVLSCRLEFPDGTVQRQCQRFPSVKREFLKTSRLIRFFSEKKRAAYFLGPWFDNRSSVYPDWIWGAFFFFRRNLLDIFPGKKLPETYFMYGEDIEWCYLVRKSGKSVFYFADAVVVHHMGGSSPERKVREMFVNEKDFILRYYGPSFWRRWKFWRKMNYALSAGKHPEFRNYRDILGQI